MTELGKRLADQPGVRSLLTKRQRAEPPMPTVQAEPEPPLAIYHGKFGAKESFESLFNRGAVDPELLYCLQLYPDFPRSREDLVRRFLQEK